MTEIFFLINFFLILNFQKDLFKVSSINLKKTLITNCLERPILETIIYYLCFSVINGLCSLFFSEYLSQNFSLVICFIMATIIGLSEADKSIKDNQSDNFKQLLIYIIIYVNLRMTLMMYSIFYSLILYSTFNLLVIGTINTDKINKFLK